MFFFLNNSKKRQTELLCILSQPTKEFHYGCYIGEENEDGNIVAIYI